MPIRAVTFDFHNTLARCDAWFDLEVREIVPRFLTWHADTYGAVYAPALLAQAITRYRSMRLEVMEHGNEIDALDGTMRVLEELELAIERTTVATGIDVVMRMAMDVCSPMPGVTAAIHELADAGLRLGVVSSAVYHPFLEWSLASFGVLDCFDSVITSARAGFYKSRTEIYTHALETLGVCPSATVHVGDSYRYDVQAARRLGIQTVWFNPAGTTDQGDEADLIVDTLEGLAPRIFDRFGIKA